MPGGGCLLCEKALVNRFKILLKQDLLNEIPAFLHYLVHNVDDIDFSKSRMVFTSEQLSNDELIATKEESRSGLYKELFIYFQEWFFEHEDVDQVYATAKNIKKEWFN